MTILVLEENSNDNLLEKIAFSLGLGLIHKMAKGVHNGEN